MISWAKAWLIVALICWFLAAVNANVFAADSKFKLNWWVLGAFLVLLDLVLFGTRGFG